MLERTHIGLKVDVDTLRGTREGVPRLAALFKRLGVDATFYFSVGPDHTGRAMRRVFRKGFAQKVARTSVLKHYGLKTLLYGVLLPGPDIGRGAGAVMRSVHDGGFEVGLHTHDHVRWQDYVAGASEAWTRMEFERGMNAFKRVFGFFPTSHAAAGWQINAHALELEREFNLAYASDTRGRTPFWPLLEKGRSSCPQLPTTLPTFDELLGRDGIDESNIADAVFRLSEPTEHDREPSRDSGLSHGSELSRGGSFPRGESRGGENFPRGESSPGHEPLHVFTLHAELEGMLLLPAFESLLRKWQAAGAHITRMAEIRALSLKGPMPDQTVVMGEVPGRSGLLAMQPAQPEAA